MIPSQDMENLALKEVQNMPFSSYGGKPTEASGKQNIFQLVLSRTNNLPPTEKAYNRMSHEGVVSIAAGGETTARAMTIATYFLLSEPEILRHLEEELQHIMPEPSSRPALRQLERLPWLVSRHSASCVKTSEMKHRLTHRKDCYRQRKLANHGAAYY